VLAEQWKRLRAAYDAVMDAPVPDRPRLLDELSGSDPALASELGKLLAVADDEVFLATPLARLAPPPLSADAELCGRFVLLRRIGRGGMGEVWAAHDRKLNEDIAIKIVRQDTTDAQAMRRVTREIQLARRISHPNVCRVNELFEDTSTTPPRSFLTMELLDGETLAARLARDGPMAPGEALDVFRLLVAGVSAAHDADVIHRDLKPANIMLLGDSGSRRVAIMDFGLARDPVRSESDGATAVGALLGTPEYMSPEQVSGGPVTPATDIYALGLILFEMLRGRRPFEGSNTLDSWMRRAREGPKRLSGVVPGVEARIDAVIGRCLEYEPGRRYQSAAELLKALDRSFYIAVPRSRRFWVPTAAAVAAALVAVGLVAWNSTRPELPPAQVMQWYEDAQQALAEGASVRALNAVNRAIELAPWFAPSHALLAEVQLELDMPGRAQESMLRAGENASQAGAWPALFTSHIAGMQALLLRQCDDAIREFRAMAAVEDSLRPYRMVSAARAMERCDRPDDALALMQEGAALDPRNAAIPLRQALLFARRREWASATKALTVAESLFRDRNNLEGVGEALTLTGTFEVEQDLLEQATGTLAKASDVARSLDDVRQQVRIGIQQAIVARKRGQVNEANQLTESAIQLARRQDLETLTLEGLFASGNVHMVRIQLVEAEALFRRALTIAETHRHDEQRARARLALAGLFVRMPDAARAAEELAVAREYYARTKQTRLLATADVYQGQIHLMRAEFENAARRFESAMSQAARAGDREQEVTFRENLAAALAGSGDYATALERYTQALTVHMASRRVRSEVFARLSIAETLSRMGRFDEADTALAMALKGATLGPEIASQIWRVEALLALRRGRYAEAVRAARRVLASGPTLSRVRATQAHSVICVASARLKRMPQVKTACDEAIRLTADRSHPASWLQARLAAAEAYVVIAANVAAGDVLEEIAPVLAPKTDHEDRWRLLALLEITASNAPAAREAGTLTRELARLRLLWQDDGYWTWRRRTDVTALLASAGIHAQNERSDFPKRATVGSSW
jgi:tetratricopeptide (TPR) repeat protein